MLVKKRTKQKGAGVGMRVSVRGNTVKFRKTGLPKEEVMALKRKILKRIRDKYGSR